MCECLSYEDGAEYLCEACGPRWREYEASIQRRPVTAPAPLDAAVEEARERWAFWEESAAAPRRLNEDYIRKLMDAVAEQRDVTAERDAAVARLNRIREWAGGLGWLGSPQDERVETEALAILDSVDRWQSCPDYIRGLPHTECAKCGGFGAVPAPQKGATE